MSKWTDNLVNLNQTPEERRSKYQFARQHGLNSSHAHRVRDWRWSKIYRRLGVDGNTPAMA